MIRQTPLDIQGDSALARTQQKSFEWYTPARYVSAVRDVMGGIDVDPASSSLANTVIQAAVYYDKDSNGLVHDWPGRVYLNPPYCRTHHVSNQEIWTCRLIAQYEAGITTQAILLVNASTDTGWFQRLWSYPICFTNHRINFWSLDNERGGPTHGSAFVYFGRDCDRFVSAFSRFGVVVRRVCPVEQTLWQEGTF